MFLKYDHTAKEKEDRLKARLAIEEDLEDILSGVVGKYKWNDSLYSKIPTSLLPESEKNAQMINEILIKSWEIQGSKWPNSRTVLVPNNTGQLIHGLLMHYFKSLNIADNVRRVTGVLDGTYEQHRKTIAHSFLKVGDHIIENAFDEEKIIVLKESPELSFKIISNAKYYDVDPANPEYAVKPSELGLENERLVCDRDEKVEQLFLWCFSDCTFYDVLMRKFIKEKYGVEIENLADKWIKLCWNCFSAAEELKKCSKCRIARYCGKNCQAQDWKIHKVLHEKLHRFLRK